MKVLEKITAPRKQGRNNVITVAFLGDSVTQGCFDVYMTGKNTLDTYYDYDSAYSTKFREIINLLYPDLQVNIINAGISGDNAANGLARMDEDVLAYTPDLLVVSYGLNDAAGGGADKAKDYAENLKGIFNKAKEKGCDVIYLTQNYMNTCVSPHLKEPLLIELAKNFAAVQNGNVLKKYFEEGKKSAAECGAAVCDCYSVWEKMEQASVNVTELLSNKLNHPIKELHTYIAIKLVEKILGINI